MFNVFTFCLSPLCQLANVSVPALSNVSRKMKNATGSMTVEPMTPFFVVHHLSTKTKVTARHISFLLDRLPSFTF